MLGLSYKRVQRLPRVHHTTLEVRSEDVPACMDFYQNILGLKAIVSLVRNSAWFEEGIHLYWGLSFERHDSEVVPPRHVALVVGDRYNEIRSKCWKMRLFVTDGSEYWGSKRCYVVDPAGNRIEIMEYPPK